MKLSMTFTINLLWVCQQKLERTTWRRSWEFAVETFKKKFKNCFSHFLSVESRASFKNYFFYQTMRTKVFSVIFLFAVIIDSSLSVHESWIKNMKFEKNFIRAMEDYIESQESVLQLLRKKLLNFKVEHWEAEENPEAYFANELNRFLLLKRITSDTSQLSDKTLHVAENFKAEVDSLKRENYFPSRNDLISSALSLATLQKSQDLRTDKLAKGIFGEIKIR